MTRINVVPVTELCDKHLLAEYRELPRVFKLARTCPEAPLEYTLGSGHVKFFYNKLTFLIRRYKQLVEECQSRGFRVNYTESLERLPDVDPPDELFNDYIPTKEALHINRERIADRISKFRRGE